MNITVVMLIHLLSQGFVDKYVLIAEDIRNNFS